jgi:hypothetical protein
VRRRDVAHALMATHQALGDAVISRGDRPAIDACRLFAGLDHVVRRGGKGVEDAFQKRRAAVVAEHQEGEEAGEGAVLADDEEAGAAALVDAGDGLGGRHVAADQAHGQGAGLSHFAWPRG